MLNKISERKAGKNKKLGDKWAEDLRTRAGKLLAAKVAALKAPPPEDVRKLIHELQARQVELDIQNETLRSSMRELEDARLRYANLYDFAPAAYFTFDRKGRILEANLTGARLLGVERGNLLGGPFFPFLAKGFKQVFDSHLQGVFTNGASQTCELELAPRGGHPFPVAVESIAVADHGGGFSRCRSFLGAVSALQRAGEKIQHLASFPELNPHPVLEVNASGTITYFNPATLKALEKLGVPGKIRYFLPADLEEILKAARQKADLQFYREVQIEDTVFGEQIYFTPPYQVLRLYAVDITDRKRAEEEFKTGEESFRELFDNISNAVAVYEVRGNGEAFIFKDFNRAGEQIENISKEELLGKEVREVFPAVADFGLLEVFQRVWQTGRGEHVPVAFYQDNRISGWKENYVYRLPSGEIVAVYDDVSARKQAETEIERLASFPQLNPNPVLEVDVSGVVTYHNAAALKALQKYGVQDLKAFFPLDMENILKSCALGVERQFHREVEIKGAVFLENIYLPADCRTARIYAMEITDHKRAEEALRLSEEKFSRAFMTSPVGLTIFRLSDGAILECNDNLLQAIGYRREEVLGRSHLELDIGVDQAVRDDFFRTLLDQGEVLGLETTFRARDGRLIPARLSARTLEVAGDPCALVISQDITVQKQAEEAIKRQSAILNAINRIFREALTCETLEDLGRTSLAVAEELTGSRFGFICRLNQAGLLDDIVISDPGWDVCTPDGPEGRKLLQNLKKHGIYGRALLDGKSLIANDPSSHPDRNGAPEGHPPIIAFLGTPLKHGGKIIGMIGLGNKPGGYDNNDLEALEALSIAVVEAFLRKRAEELIRCNAARAEALVRIAARLNAQLDLDEVLQAVCELAAQAVKVPAAAFSLYDETRQVLAPAAGFGFPVDVRETFGPIPYALFAACARQADNLIVIPDIRAVPTLPNVEQLMTLDIRTLIITVMEREEQLLGVLTVCTMGETRRFTEDDLELLRGFAHQAAQAVANARLFADNLKKLETLLALYASAEKLTRSLDLQEVAEEVARTCVETFGASLAWIGRAEPDGRVSLLNQFPHESGYPPQIIVRWDDAPGGQGTTGRAIRTGFPVVSPDLAADEGYGPWRESPDAAEYRTRAAFPLMSRGKAFGSLNLYSHEPGFFTPERVEFFQAYASLPAAALENARLFAETEQRFQHAQALCEVYRVISSSADLPTALNFLLGHVISQLGADAATILSLSKFSQTLEYAAGRGFHSPALQHTRLSLGQGYAGRVAVERRIVVEADLRVKLDEWEWGRVPTEIAVKALKNLKSEGFVTYHGVPLIAQGELKGVLEIFHRFPFTPDQEWLGFLKAFAAQAAIAIANAEYQEKCRNGGAAEK